MATERGSDSAASLQKLRPPASGVCVASKIGSLKYEIASDLEANKEVVGLQQRLVQVGTDIHQLSHDLHLAVLQDGGLPEALSGYCEEFSKARGIPVTCETDEGVVTWRRAGPLPHCPGGAGECGEIRASEARASPPYEFKRSCSSHGVR
jgi:hypothetical protein